MGRGYQQTDGRTLRLLDQLGPEGENDGAYGKTVSQKGSTHKSRFSQVYEMLCNNTWVTLKFGQIARNRQIDVRGSWCETLRYQKCMLGSKVRGL